MSARKGIGELLVRESLIDINQLERARQEQKQTGGRLTSALVQLGFVKDRDLAEFMGKQYNLPTVDLFNFEIDPEAIKLVSQQLCRKHMVIPVQKSGRSLVVAFADPSNLFIKDDLSLLTRCKIELVVASENSILVAIEKYYGGSSGERMDTLVSQIEESQESLSSDQNKVEVMTVDQDGAAEDGPIIAFVNALLAEAIKLKASDIHIETYEKRFRIRFRIDGSLIEIHQPPQSSAGAIVSRLKILSKMDIAERRKPQDGRLKVKLKNKQEIDFRVNCLPTLFGEKVVLRILDKSNLQVDMFKLGMEPEQLELFQNALALPQGMILITGPTGSGKTTTVYSALGALNTVDVNISTAEDPVEFNFDGINQVHVHPEIGFGFPEALRAFLRQDPEVIMVGEIRDMETASIAYKAAATGHLVISTLHTNDTASTVNRLISMGVADYLVAESTSLVVAQRLIKRICTNCITEARVPEDTLLGLGVMPDELSGFASLRKGEGCEKCNGSGLSGRMAIFEVLKFSVAVKEAIFKGGSTLEVKRQAILVDKMISLRRAAILKLKEGATSVEEVLAGTVADDL
ncbi:MAG: type IV-A pilus assembly ATPase PilB [Bdellovibrionales bacterium]|nr:type IV-A pilus assembly ATPase PilB [Bdellovibrionales bacterium]